MAPAADRVQVEIAPAFARHGIVAIGYNHPQFKATAENLLGADNAALAEPLLSYSLLLKNNNPSRIAIVVLRYPRLNSAGRSVGFLEVFTLLPFVSSVASSEGIILSPEGQVNDSLNQLKSPKTYPFPPPAAIATSRSWFATHFDSLEYSRVTVSLDSVVFEDGGVVGPDRFGIIALQQAQTAAHREFLVRVQDQNATEKDLTEWLLTRKDLAFIGDADELETQIRIYQMGFARMMLSALRNPKVGGKSGLVTSVENLISRTVPKPESLRKLD